MVGFDKAFGAGLPLGIFWMVGVDQVSVFEPMFPFVVVGVVDGYGGLFGRGVGVDVGEGEFGEGGHFV